LKHLNKTVGVEKYPYLEYKNRLNYEINGISIQKVRTVVISAI
jgi:hypothetical protein